MMRTNRFFGTLLFLLLSTGLCCAADYTTFINTERGFTEVTSTDAIWADANYYYILVPAETNELIVGVGAYEAKPDWASTESKALRYKSAATDPVLDLTNFFTIEKSGQYIGLRNVVYSADLFQTHDNAGYMYVNTFTDKNLDEWSYLIPHWQSDGYWLFENGKYPASNTEGWRGYMGSWTPGRMVVDEPIALNRLNTDGDPAGHYRLFRIVKTDLLTQQHKALLNASASNPLNATWLITNPSFETGDETGWTLIGKDPNGNDEFKTRDYGMTGKDGNYLMNAYQWWASSLSVSQTITNAPCGQYELYGTVASFNGRTISFTANSNSATATGVNDATGVNVNTNVTIGIDGKLIITVGSTTDWWTEDVTHADNDNRCFFKLDDVRLICKGVFLNAYAIPLPNNDATQLQAGQWYYYDVDFGMDYTLLGNTYNMVVSADGDKPLSEVTTTAAARQMPLPSGRVYFKTTRSDATLSLHPARNVEESGTFTAVALNVDGLPQKIATYDLNPDGPGRDGTLKISQYLASKGYDFIGCSEDFNYNGALMEYLDGYSCGKIRNTLSVTGLDYWQLIQGNIHVDTDGLNLLWKNSKISATNESWTPWNSTESTDGNQYVNKGYRHYDVQIDGENGPVIDVYILHMDAGDTNATWSRESQWQQLAAAINNTDLTRPKLVIGDTNSRYTREDVISHFINRLSTDFTMSDVWVEFYRNGIYPTTDMGDLTDQSDVNNYSNYEIVDKIIYINPKAANTVQLVPVEFKIEHDYTYDYVDHDGNTTPLGDHHPVVVTFKYQLSGDALPTPITLADAADNSSTLAKAEGALANVTLQGRTLFKDGSWNTLCLPFSMTAQQVSEQLAPAGLMEFDTQNKWLMVNGQWIISDEGHKTGIDGNTLYLNFKDATTINAGTPYIIKWTSGDALVNPIFNAVTVAAGDAGSISSTDGSVTFLGTYNPVPLVKDDQSNLYLADDNNLYYPSADNFFVNAFRAYFQLSDPTKARRFVLNFSDNTATDIISIENGKWKIDNKGTVYNLNGQRVNVGAGSMPARQKGIFVVNGKKLVIK